MNSTPSSPNRARLFYSGAAAVLLVLMFLGFQRFYLHAQAYPGRELTPPIRTLIILHGVGMSAWMLLSVVQPLLIVGGNRRIHMTLGQVGALLAAAVVVLGWRLGIESARVSPPQLRIWGLPPKQFMTVPVISVIIFAGLVIAGVWNRRRPDVHRPMMLLASLSVMSAAVSRIDLLSNLYRGTVWEAVFGPFFWTLIVGLIFVVVKWLLTRSWDWWFALGNVGLVVVSALIMKLAPTTGWDQIATFLLR